MTHRTSRRNLLAVAGGVGAIGLAGCLDALVSDDGPEPVGTPTVGGTGARSGDGEFEFFLHEPELVVDYEAFAGEARSGGVPQDGIPSIDEPQFGDVEYGDDMLSEDRPVFGVNIEGEKRAYSQRILVRHEIVNDTLAGYDIAVTYCPLTGTAIGFDRGDDTFGVSGQLVNSNLIMFDRSSESWWPQVLGTLVKGDEDADTLGTKLGEFRVTWTTWGRWKAVYPDTEVLSENNEHAFAYSDPYGGYNPNSGYYASDSLMFPVMHEDDRFHPKHVVIGARSRDGTVAFEKRALRDAYLLETTVGDVSYLGVYHEALDSGWVYRNPDALEFTRVDNGYESPDGDVYPANGLPLEEINAFDAMWFAWYAFYPETEVVT